jgi:hypothetical protein
MFDLSPYAAEGMARGRAVRLLLTLWGLFFLAVWAVLFVPKFLAGGSGPLLLVESALFVAVVLFLFAMAAYTHRRRAAPNQLTVDSHGITLEYPGNRKRSWLWSDAKRWLELVDIRGPAETEPRLAHPSPFYLRRLDGRPPVFLPEEAFQTILSVAVRAGVPVTTWTSPGGRHLPVPGALLYLHKDRVG